MKTKIVLIIVTVIQLAGFTVPAAECVTAISKTQRKGQIARLLKTITNNVLQLMASGPEEQRPSQRELAAHLGVSEQKMSAMLHNRVSYTPFDVLRLATLFNVDPSDLLSEAQTRTARSDTAKSVHIANIKTAVSIVTARLPGINAIRALDIAANVTAGLAPDSPSSQEVIAKAVNDYIISKI